MSGESGMGGTPALTDAERDDVLDAILDDRSRAEGYAVAEALGIHQLHASLNICTGCTWRATANAGSLLHQHEQHLAEQVAQIVREHTATQVAAAKAEGWAACVLEAEHLGWMHDLAADDMAGRNPYTTEEQR